MMAKSEFEKKLRPFLDQRPFQPFLIEMDDGERFVITDRKSLNYLTGDTAVFLSPTDEWSFIDCDNVKDISPVSSAKSA